MRVLYSKKIAKDVERNRIQKEVWVDFKDIFDSFSRNRNFRLFDIKKLIHKGLYVYYRLRVRSYRALFRMDDNHIYVEEIGPRGRIYKP